MCANRPCTHRARALHALAVPRLKRMPVFALLPRSVARRVLPDGKPALTEFSVVESAASADLASQGSPASRSDAALAAALQAGGLSLVSCRPLTGRTHQVGEPAALPGLLGHRRRLLGWAARKLPGFQCLGPWHCLGPHDCTLAGTKQCHRRALPTCLPSAWTAPGMQIRVHLAHAGHAILGDDIYGVTGA